MSDEESNPGLPPSEHPDFKGGVPPAALTFPMKLREGLTKLETAIGHEDKLHALSQLVRDMVVEHIAKEES